MTREGAASGVTPILVLGTARTGTTWLGNILVCQPRVAGAHHWVHWGIAESHLYETARVAGDLSVPDNLIRFLELYSASDFFRLVEGDKRDVYSNPPRDFLDLFFRLMDMYALKQKATHWVTKLDPQLLYRPKLLRSFFSRLDERYPESRVIGVFRDFTDVLRSYLSMEGTVSVHRLRGLRRSLAVVLGTARYVVHTSAVGEVVHGRKGLSVQFRDLANNLDTTLEVLGTYLGLNIGRKYFEGRYAPNSSYATRPRSVGPSDGTLSLSRTILKPIFEKLPLLARWLLRLRDGTRSPRDPFYWRLLQLEHMSDRFIAELERTGQTGLRREVIRRQVEGS